MLIVLEKAGTENDDTWLNKISKHMDMRSSYKLVYFQVRKSPAPLKIRLPPLHPTDVVP